MTPEKRLKIYKGALKLYRQGYSSCICVAIFTYTDNSPKICDENTCCFIQDAIEEHYPEFAALRPEYKRFGSYWWYSKEDRIAAMTAMIAELELKINAK